MTDLTLPAAEAAPPPAPAQAPPHAELLLGLPTLAQAAFGIIVLTFVGITLAAMLGSGPALPGLVALTLLVLPARAMMARPDKQRAAREDPAATRALQESGAYDRLLAHIDALAAAEFNYRRPIGLIIGREPNGIQAISSWRRDYLLIGHSAADKLAQQLANDPVPGWVQTIFIHELAHIAHHDERRVGFAGELLRVSATFLPWWILFSAFLVGMTFHGLAAILAIDFTTVPDIAPDLGESINDLLLPGEAERADILARAESTNVASVLIIVILSLWPIAIIGGVLYLFFWRWMVRLQEYYADLAAGRHGSTSYDLIRAMGFAQPLASGRPARRLPWSIGELLGQRRSRPRPRKRITDWFRLHPTLRERQAMLLAPELLFTDWWRVAWSAVVLSLGLDIILSSPLFLYHGLPLQLHIATTLLLVGTWLLPQLAIGRPIGRDLARVLLLIAAARLVWMALNVGLLVIQIFFFPSQALTLLNALVIATSRYSGPLDGLPVADPIVGLSAAFSSSLIELAQVGGMVVAMLLYVWWMRRSAAASPAAIRRRHWVAIITITLGTYACLWQLARLINTL